MHVIVDNNKIIESYHNKREYYYPDNKTVFKTFNTDKEAKDYINSNNLLSYFTMSLSDFNHFYGGYYYGNKS